MVRTARHPPLTLAALVLALAMTGLAPSAAAAGTTIAPPARVLVVGDSVMLGAASAIESTLGQDPLEVDAVVSRTTGRSTDAALSHGTDWDVVVAMLGHNDAGSASVYQPAYRRLLDAYADVPRVVVVTLHEVRPSYAGVNAFLRAEAERRPNVRVLDWNAVASADPGLTAHDGLHLSASGGRRMADEISAQVFRAEVELAAPPPTTTTTTTPPTTTAVPTTTTTSTTTPPTTTAPSSASTVAAAEPQDDGVDGRHASRWTAPVLLAGALAVWLAGRRGRRREPGES
ncbi:MAG: hypothetical protein KF906_02330 [Actinobacteria bacterium]|nr:hypothetical protein [Actinomycetota bacterium]